MDVGTIELDKTSEGYRQLMSVTKDVVSATVKAETEAKVKDIAMKQRIEAEDYEGRLRIQREEVQYAQHKQTQTTNIGAFQVEKQAEVGVAGANVLGHMGANGAGDINLSGGGGEGTGFNMATMMASMTVGSAVGQNIAGSMNNMMSGINQMSQISTTLPPVPVVTYNVAVNGQATGPFEISRLKQMVASGQLTKDSLVWKLGMTEWVKAGTVEELEPMFSIMPPIPPQEDEI